MAKDVNEVIDDLQGVLSEFSVLLPKNLSNAATILNVNIDLAQDVLSDPENISWEVVIATKAGNVVAVLSGAFLVPTAIGAATIALRALGPVGSFAVFVKGFPLAFDVSAELGNITRGKILEVLTASGVTDQFEGKEIPVPVEKPESLVEATKLDKMIKDLSHEDREEIKDLFKHLFVTEIDQALRDMRFF